MVVQKRKSGWIPFPWMTKHSKRSLFLDPSYYTNNLIINVLPFPHAMLWQSCFFRNINLMSYIICSDFHKTKEKIIITIELPKWFEKKIPIYTTRYCMSMTLNISFNIRKMMRLCLLFNLIKPRHIQSICIYTINPTRSCISRF